MTDKRPVLEQERVNIDFFESLAWNDRAAVDFSSVRGAQFLQPLFEFSGACAGCGETPYVRLLSQLFGPRLIVANATGCSSIYGGNLPTTPWSKNDEGSGPAWSNSLFEDNAEFGLGMRIAADHHMTIAKELVTALKDEIGNELADHLVHAGQRVGSEIRRQRRRVRLLRKRLEELTARHENPKAMALLSIVDHLVRRSIWLVGGDGWAYDIGSGGLDHVLASGRNVNVLVMDTEVYSNTGGQMSKATPLGAAAKFASAGKRIGKKDLALQTIAKGNVYGRQSATDAAGHARGRGVQRAIADPRIQPLYCTRLRSQRRVAATAAGGRERLLAAASLQPGPASRWAETVCSGFAASDDTVARVRL